MPGRSWRYQEVETPRIFKQLIHEGGKVVSLTHRPPLLPRKFLGTRLQAESTPGLLIADSRIRSLERFL